MLRGEFSSLGLDIPVTFLPGRLHFHREELRATLTEHIADCPAGTTVLLGYGRCAIAGGSLDAGPHRLVLPAVDNCLALLLGSERAYLNDLKRHPGTLYYSPGWTSGMDDPYDMYLQACERLGPEKAREWARLVFDHYSRIALIRSGAVECPSCRCYAEAVSACSGLPLVTVDGSFRLLRMLLHGPHDREFVVAEAGEALEDRAFWHRDDAATIAAAAGR